METPRIEKGQIRNTVLNRIKELKYTVDALQQAKMLKDDEALEFTHSNPSKAKKLKNQSEVLKSTISGIVKSLKKLEKYKKIKTT